MPSWDSKPWHNIVNLYSKWLWALYQQALILPYRSTNLNIFNSSLQWGQLPLLLVVFPVSVRPCDRYLSWIEIRVLVLSEIKLHPSYRFQEVFQTVIRKCDPLASNYLNMTSPIHPPKSPLSPKISHSLPPFLIHWLTSIATNDPHCTCATIETYCCHGIIYAGLDRFLGEQIHTFLQI